MRSELERQGWTAGRESVGAALGPGVPRHLVSEALRTLKAAHRADVRRHRLEHRVSMTVLARDAVWAEDSTHLGRLEDWTAISGEVVRDVGPHRTIGLTAGRPLDAEDVVAVLERLRKERGTLPLVWGTDNAKAYASGPVARYLEGRRVVPLRSLPHTPQQNGSCERANGELKPEAELGKGIVLDSVFGAAERLAPAWWRLDHERLWPSLGFRTAAEVDSTLPRWHAFVDRETFYGDVERGLAEVEGIPWPSERARRRARRDVVLLVLERHGLVRTTRGPAVRSRSLTLRVSLATDDSKRQAPSVEPLDDRPSWGILGGRSEPATVRDDAGRLPESTGQQSHLRNSNDTLEPRGSGHETA